MVEFKNLALQDVTFALCANGMALNQFKVLKQHTFEIDQTTGGSISIIGQSHIFQWSNNGDTLTEILLCVPHNFTASNPLCQTGALANFRLGLTHGSLIYAVRISTRFANSMSELVDLPALAENPNTLAFHFPQGDMPCAPVTLVTWTMSQRAIAVKTIHTFPQEKAWVETKTRLNWA
jgi:hypothetical protein